MPGVIGSLTLVLVITLTAFAVVREREIGTLEQIMVTPIRPVEFILGKTLPFFLIGLFDVSLIATVGTLWFQIPFHGQHTGIADRFGAFSSVHAGRGPAYLHRFIDAATGDGDRLFLYHARHQLFRVWISHQHHAAVAAIFHLSHSTALFSGCAARRLFKGSGDGDSVAADGRHGGLGVSLLTIAILRFHKALD